MKITLYLYLLLIGFEAFSQNRNAELYLKQGKEKMQNEDYKRAIVDFTISLEMEPSVDAFLGRAAAKRMIQDFVGAINDYQEALAMDDQNPVLFNNRGNLKDEQGSPKEAILDYDQAILLDSTYTNAYYNRAIAKYNLKNYEAAKTDFEKVLQYNSEDKDALLGLGLTEHKLGNKSKACAYFVRTRQLGLIEAEEYLQKFCQ